MTLTEHTSTPASSSAGVVTVASLARDWALRAPTQVAMREKDFGIWHDYTWARTWDLIECAAHGLLALGVEPGDRVSIHAEDRPEWIILDLATVAVRGITVGFYPTNPAAEVEYLLDDCGACVHFAEDQEQFDKVDAIDRSTLLGCARSSSSSRVAWSASPTTGCSSGTPSSSSAVSIGPNTPTRSPSGWPRPGPTT
jgi:long-subunit acyl-CoA synthetase (AMP-forming)